jgi:hypothetical protein
MVVMVDIPQVQIPHLLDLVVVALVVLVTLATQMETVWVELEGSTHNLPDLLLDFLH